MSNALGRSNSPYLLQHADNPVDWLPWGEEAFALAAESDKPILLSIGYSSCHWCHVMAHESFESTAIAEQINRDFVPVKVDREERPDVDAIYMQAVQAMTGRGGWPLTAFLTPRGEAFYGGTYFPPSPRHGMAGFPQILDGVAAAWRERREEVLAQSARLTDALRRLAERADEQAGDPSGSDWASDLLASAREAYWRAIDEARGGFGGAPKFPQAPALAFLLDDALRLGHDRSARAVAGTLDAMARGGLWDHLGGGFHRYCVDADWSVPHFEKMLYDNAQLARLYLDAGRLSPAASTDAAGRESREVDDDPSCLDADSLPAVAWGASRWRAISLATSGYVLRELGAGSGGFGAAQDADTSEGEGAYLAWREDELTHHLYGGDPALAGRWFGFEPGGNFESGRQVLATRTPPATVAGELATSLAEVERGLNRIYASLRAARGQRQAPATDDKIIAAWNGLMIDALARQAMATRGRLSDLLYSEAAEAADFLFRTLRVDDGLARSWREGRVGVAGFLSDHASLGAACLTLYEARFEPRWFRAAEDLAASMIEQFGDPEGGFFASGPRNEQLILRRKPWDDGALPGGNAMALELLMRLHALTGDPGLAERVEAGLRAARPTMSAAPLAAGSLLRALASWKSGWRGLVVIGDMHAGAAPLLDLAGPYRPALVRAWAANPDAAARAGIPLLQDRQPIEGRAAAYLCRGQTCSLPVTEPEALAELLDETDDPPD